MLTANIWSTTASNVKKILDMDEWKEEKFRRLLTSNIWSSNYEEVKDILNMDAWNEPVYEPLLTSNIWKRNKQDIEAIVGMERLREPKYSHLLTPSIFSVSSKNVSSTLDLFEKYGISDYVTKRSLRRDPDEQEKLIKYLLRNNVNLVVNYNVKLEKKSSENVEKSRLNPILCATDSELKLRYGIDINKVLEEDSEIVKD